MIKTFHPRLSSVLNTLSESSEILYIMDVVTGKIIPMVRDTRTEQDFADWLDSMLMSDPAAAGWHFVMDRLNTHMSEAAVKAVARIEGTTEKELGVKGKSGILKNMKTRAAYLSVVSHKVVFHCTPKHASWLNQIENAVWVLALGCNRAPVRVTSQPAPVTFAPHLHPATHCLSLISSRTSSNRLSIANKQEQNIQLKEHVVWLEDEIHRLKKLPAKPGIKPNTKWNYWKLFGLAFDGITSFSVRPLKLASFNGGWTDG